MVDKYGSQIQTNWNWCIAAYLFLAGVGAGGYATGVLATFLGWQEIATTGVSLGFPLLLLGTLFLIADLGVKHRALRVFLNPGTSWIARGSLIISVFMILSFVHLVLLWSGQQFDSAQLKLIGGVNAVFSVLVMVYTGVLLGASRAIAFWNTAMLPLLFLLSASSTGLLATLLLSPSREGLEPAYRFLARADLFLLVLESLVVVFYLQASHRTDESRASVQLLLKGRLSSMFWFGLVTLGLAIPLAIELVELLSAEGQTGTALLRVAAVAGLAGGLFLRRLILAAGVRTPLRAGGIEFTFPSPVIR
jgi:formate-dependent nitrite reductase membrane component NrfD